MYIPFVDLSGQPDELNSVIKRNIKSVIKTKQFILGKEVEQFEKEFAAYLGVKYCSGVASGTDAILLSLLALGIGKGDEVIVPVMTFIATVLPIIFLGAVPKLVDIVSTKLPLIDVDHIEKVINRRTKAIIAVHLQGQPCDMERIIELAQRFNLYVIEDACQAHGAELRMKGTSNWRKTGSMGDIGCFSFYPAKNLGAFGDGGAVVTSNRKISDKINLLRNYGARKKYIHTILGVNSRLDTLQAAVLSSKLPYLDWWNKRRCYIASYYNKLFGDFPIDLPIPLENRRSNYHIYAIGTKRRNALLKFLKKQSIICGIHYPLPLHHQPALSFLGYDRKDFPHATEFARRTLSLPMFPQLKDKEIQYVVSKIRMFFDKE